MARINEIAAQHVQRSLRGVPAYAFAVARKAQRAVSAAVGVRKGDVNEADGLFGRTAGGTRDSGDPDAERRADSTADSLRQSLRDFRTDGAFGLNELGGHVGPRRLQIVAIANDPAQKIRGASRNTGESFGEQSSSATFRGSHGRAG